MYSWNPSSYSTPLDKPARNLAVGQARVSDLSAIVESPNLERDLSAAVSPRARSSMLLQSVNSGIFERQFNAPLTASQDRVIGSGGAFQERVLSNAPVASGTSFSSLLTPRFHDDLHHDTTYHSMVDSIPLGMASLDANEKLDLDQANNYLQECVRKDLIKLDIADQLIGTNAGTFRLID